ncbi:hypothetical protein [Winogradskyella sp.]|uniref:hypothetical protein n=1 Tax=Winogradskyella sp. TaxID=1883156 RepID=UPI002604560A|nr:hypothetical protein [Winogradskyella sp.]
MSIPSDYSCINYYVIKDSLNKQIGSMVFYTELRDNKVISIDTSKFNDGSIHETAKMTYDIKKNILSSLKTDIKTRTTSMNIDLENSTERIQGHYKFNRNGKNIIDRKVDSVIRYDIFREELYMLVNLMSLKDGDNINFKMLFSDNLQTTVANLFYESFEKVKVPAGEFNTNALYLDTGGIIDNRIWINTAAPNQVVKFYIPGQGLSIELIENSRTNSINKVKRQ